MKKKRILLLEDSLIVSKLIATLLKSHGYDVIECSSCQEARAISVSPDMAILDYRLPDGNGLEIAEMLRAKSPTIPMVLLTARGTEVSKEQARAAGVREYLDKPVESDRLMALVQSFLS